MTTLSNAISLDTDSEDEFSSVQKCRRSERRRVSRSSEAAKSKKPRKNRVKKTTLLVDDDDDNNSLIFLEGSPDTKLLQEVSSRVVMGNSTDGINLQGPTDVMEAASLAENIKPVISQPRKTARRGLAKKHNELPAEDSSTLSSHKVSVYSQAIDKGFTSLLHGTGSVEAVIDRLETKNLSEYIETDLPVRNADSGLTESRIDISQQDQGSLEEVDEKSLISALKIQSPSPPPKSAAGRVKPLNKKLTRALKTLNQAKMSLNKKTPPRKSCSRRDSDVIIVGEETGVSKEITVKVRYITKVYRIQMKLNEPFHVLIKKMSKEIYEAEQNLGLFLHDRALKETETPQSVKLSVADIIECHCINVCESSSVDTIELVIQCRNNKSRTVITTNKRLPFCDIIQKYAELINAKASSFTFSFDGEDLEPSDTPSKLEMEDQDVIDVVYS